MSKVPRNSTSVVIIGAGIVGSSVAYHLSARGCNDIIVLEKADTEVAGSSARSAAGVRHQFANQVNIQLSQYSIKRLKRFTEEVGGEAGLKQIGYLLLVSEPNRWEQSKRSVALQNSLGVPSRALSPEQVLALMPSTNLDGLLGATYCAEDGHCDPHGIATGYLWAARRHGVELKRATPAIGMRRAGRRVTAVDTPAGSIACEVVVNAAGPWSGKVGALAGIQVPVQPYRRCIYMTEPMPSVPSFPFVIDTASGFYMRKEGDKLLIGVTDESEPPGENLAVNWDWLEIVLERGAERFPFLANAGIIRRNCWAGLYRIRPTHMPILGRHPELTNYVDASGFSGHGVMHSPATRMVTAEEVLEGRAHTIILTTFESPDSNRKSQVSKRMSTELAQLTTPVGHQNSPCEWTQPVADARGSRSGVVFKIKRMVTVINAMLAYLRAFILPRHRLGLETAALRQQLAVFKRKQPRPRLRRVDRVFWGASRHLWSGWADALIIVKPETVVSWHRAGFRLFWRLRSSIRRPGRPKISAEIRELIRRMKADNPIWGAPRIHGELLQLGFEISEPTVSRYLRQLKRRCDSAKAKRWLIFLHNHREVIAALDFFTVPTLTFRVLYGFFVIEHGRRRILHFHATAHPTSDRIVQQLREAFPLPCPYRYAVLDRDAKFSPQVLEILMSSGTEPIRTSVRSPWQNGVAERWVGMRFSKTGCHPRRISTQTVGNSGPTSRAGIFLP